MKRYQPKDYEIRVWWSEDDDAFLAQVLDMPGIMTHGDTPEDAARENYVALQLALDSTPRVRARKRPLPGEPGRLSMPAVPDASAAELPIQPAHKYTTEFVKIPWLAPIFRDDIAISEFILLPCFNRESPNSPDIASVKG